MTVSSKTSFFTHDKNKRAAAEMRDLSYIPEDTEVVIDDNTTNDGFNDGTAASNSLELSQLHMFAISGNRKKLQEAINTGSYDINETDNMGRTPLIYSVLVEQMDCVILLLKSGANPDKPDGDGRTALHWAAYQGNHKLVKLIIGKCKMKSAYDKEGRTPLHLSISHDNIKVIQIILKYLDRAEVDAIDNKSMTALCWAVFYERIEHTKLLLSHGASRSILDSEGRSVLHWTSQNKTHTLISLLLEEGCNTINFQDKEGRTTLHMAVGHGGDTMVQYLLSVPDISINQQDAIKRTPLHWAAVLGQKHIVEMLLNRGADYSIPDCNGARALHYAAQNNNFDVVISMLNLHKVTDKPDNENRTALMWAALKGSLEVMKVLLERKCTDVNAVDVHQQTALHMSCVAGHLECVKLLVSFGADVNIVDKKHHIPLFYACMSGHVEIVSELLGQNAMSNLDCRDAEGRTALHFSAMVDRRAIIKILIEHKLDPNTQDKAGCQPLHIAAYGGFVHCMSVLLENGARVNMQDIDGRTALHMACRSGALDAVKLLVSRYQADVNILDKSDTGLTALDYAFLEDHQDVIFFLVENSAYTASIIKDIAATKIQAFFRGYKFRKDFADKRELLLKHEKTRKRDVTPTTLSSGSDTQSVKLNPLWRMNPDDDNNSAFVSTSDHPSQSGNIVSSSGAAGTSSGMLRVQQSQSYIEVPRRQRTRSQNSVVSGISVVSSRSSVYLNPEKAKQSSDARQGPKFYDGSANPFSLNRVSRALSPYADTKLFANPPPKAKSTTGVITHKPEKPYKRLSSVDQQDTNSKFRKHSTKSSTSAVEHFTSQVDRGKIADRDRNSLYNISYSRHATNDKKAMSDSSGSTLFKARSKHYPLPQISVFNSSFRNDEDSSSSHSPPSKPVLKPIQPTTSAQQPVFQPTPPSHPPPISTKKIYGSSVHTEGDNKPWNVFRRDQKRINIIRQKTEAAVKIQRVFRLYCARKNPNIAEDRQFYNNSNNNSNLDLRSTPDFSLNSERTSASDHSMTEVESTILNPDSETDSYDTGFGMDYIDEIPDEETLHEVAALVIQATWRQYVKNKLILEVKRTQNTVTDETSVDSIGEESNDEDSRPPIEIETTSIPPDTPLKKERKHKKHKHLKDNSRFPTTKTTENGELHHSEITVYQNLKKKLVPSQSFPLMQNIYRESMRKKRTKRFSIKKRLLSRPADAPTPPSSSPTVRNTPSSNITDSSLVSISSASLTKSEMEAVKSRKSKVVLSRTKRVDLDH